MTTAISADDLRDRIDNQAGIPVINVLDEDDFHKRHIPGSINIPVSRPDFVQRVQREVPDKANPVIVYCASRNCDASSKAAKALDDAGFHHVLDYEDGVAGWAEAGYELDGAETHAQA